MISLFRKPDDSRGDRIEERFKEMVLSYKTNIIRNADYHNVDGNKVKLPFIKENNMIYSAESEIKSYLNTLEKELNQQRMITADACYIDPGTGEVC